MVDIFIPLILIVLMLIVGMGLQLTHFYNALKQPYSILGGTILLTFLLPFIAIAIIFITKPKAEIAAGLALISACPGGALSNFYCHLGKYNVALSVILTALSSILSFITLPLILAVIFPLINLTEKIDIPIAELVIQMLILLVVPVGAGMLIRRLIPKIVINNTEVMRALGLILVVLLLGLIFYTQWEGTLRLLNEAVFASTIFTLVTLVTGWVIGLVLHHNVTNRNVFAIEFSVRNAGVAAVVASASLGRPEFVIFGALFVVVQFPMIMLMIFSKRFLKHPKKV